MEHGGGEKLKLEILAGGSTTVLAALLIIPAFIYGLEIMRGIIATGDVDPRQLVDQAERRIEGTEKLVQKGASPLVFEKALHYWGQAPTCGCH